MKTASTLLQSEVFPYVPDSAFYTYASGFPHRVHALRNAPDSARLDELASDMRGWVDASGEALQLFSWEGLVGDYLGDYRDRDMMLELMLKVAPDAHILLVIRKQADLANSLYKQALHRGHWSSIERFLNWQDGTLGDFDAADPANLSIHSLNFDAAVGRYEQAYGANHVHVLAYEWLRENPDRFWSNLEAALDRSIERPERSKVLNVGYNSASATLARKLNRLFRTPQNPRGLFPYRPLDSAIRAAPKGVIRRKLLSLLNAPFDPRWLLQGSVGRRLRGSNDLIPSEVRKAIEVASAPSNRALDERRSLGLGELRYY